LEVSVKKILLHSLQQVNLPETRIFEHLQTSLSIIYSFCLFFLPQKWHMSSFFAHFVQYIKELLALGPLHFWHLPIARG